MQLFRQAGRSAALSPSGSHVAFTDSRLGLAVRDLDKGRDTRLMNWVRIAGIGGWSPDGQFLLAGAYTSFSMDKRLVLVELASGCFVRSAGLVKVTMEATVDLIRGKSIDVMWDRSTLGFACG